VPIEVRSAAEGGLAVLDIADEILEKRMSLLLPLGSRGWSAGPASARLVITDTSPD